jgi:hypothetical protein
MTNQSSNQPKQEQPPIGFYVLMGTLAVCLTTVLAYLIATYFAK